MSIVLYRFIVVFRSIEPAPARAPGSILLAPITVYSSDDDAIVFYPEAMDISDGDATVWFE